jgi:hypothetical protein
MLANIEPRTFLLTTTFTKDEIWNHLPALCRNS